MVTATTTPVLAYALAYARRGWPVMPVNRETKKPEIAGWSNKDGKETTASTDEAKIRSWWRQWPEANIGMPCGPKAGVWVLDIDPRNGGDVSLDDLLMDQDHSVFETLTARTGGGGRHFYFRWPEGRYVGTPKKGIASGIDVKGAGGYIVLPPSVHASGGVYDWIIEPEDGIADAPEWLLDYVAPRDMPDVHRRREKEVKNWGAYALAALESEVDEVRTTPEGGRNPRLNQAAFNIGRFVQTGWLEYDDAAGDLQLAGEAAGLPPPEVRATVKSGLNAEHDPADMPPQRSTEELGGLLRGEGDGSKLPKIILTPHVQELADLVWPHLLKREGDGRLFRTECGQEILQVSGGVSQHMQKEQWNAHLAHSFQFYARTKEAVKPASLPVQNRSDLRYSPHRDSLPVLRGVVSVPDLTEEGRLICKPGYDEGTGIFYAPRGLDVPDVPERPTASEVETARDRLLGLLRAFPFENEASRANMLGAILAPLVRGLYSGASPAVWLDANTPGAGKSLLAEIISTIAVGRAGVQPLADDRELRKQIDSALLANPRALIVLDNIRRRVEGGALEALITAGDHWKGRRLGASEEISLPNRSTVILTSNDATMSPDMAERVLPVILHVEDKAAHEARDFGGLDIREQVREHRADFVHAAFVLALHWVAVGRPAPQRNFQRFEAFGRTVGGIVEAAGVEGWLANRADARERATVEDLPHELEVMEYLGTRIAEVDTWPISAGEIADTLGTFNTGVAIKQVAAVLQRLGWAQRRGRAMDKRTQRYRLARWWEPPRDAAGRPYVSRAEVPSPVTGVTGVTVTESLLSHG